MPAPAVIRFSSPGRTIACTPALSRCSTSPLEQPTDGLQPGVRMRRHVHPAGRRARRVGRSGRRNTTPRSATAPAAAACVAPGSPAGRPAAPRVDAAHRRMAKPHRRLRRARCRCCSRTHSSDRWLRAAGSRKSREREPGLAELTSSRRYDPNPARQEDLSHTRHRVEHGGLACSAWVKTLTVRVTCRSGWRL